MQAPLSFTGSLPHENAKAVAKVCMSGQERVDSQAADNYPQRKCCSADPGCAAYQLTAKYDTLLLPTFNLCASHTHGSGRDVSLRPPTLSLTGTCEDALVRYVP
ncbi:hypothetical protein SNOG_03817 [Parastagonospora nodorum SN15]|uniref:Uncharacterized protein n=1 Tax=Phaeosphaeria nodorum (strain SN15 / ATCC MYA-4574 / FGSC 10173) TaxID=321614 RepID=Q0UWP7_PHANO|nr:hypothetical protein SNOG_03817 [Parastagonospora nodorum SN15]EAT89022.1 hypothetical protein SNOG_03817 [Parastagonospora nodorum SN15]